MCAQKGKRMRNLAEQKKLVNPIIWFIFMAILYVIIIGVLFLNVLDVDFSIAGYRLYDFNEEVEKVDPYDVDDGEIAFYIEKGSKVIVKEIAFDELQKNDVIAYYEKDAQTVIVHTAIYVEHHTNILTEETNYVMHPLDSTEQFSDTIASERLLGKYVTAIPGIGAVSTALGANKALMYAAIIGLALIMLGIPLIVFILRLKARRIGSPFPEGVNVNKLKTENLYIYENIKSFILSSGMTIENGYDCDLIYTGNKLFGVLHCTNGNMYVNINKNFQRYDNKIDRAGYICIPHAGNIETAKKRINSIYRAYFMDAAERRKQPRRQPGKRAQKRR